MMLTLMLAAGLLTAPAPLAEPQKGWVVEVRSFAHHRQAKPKDRFIIEFQWPLAKPQPEPVEVQAIEAIYVDDLRAFIEQLKKR
jgi:hypothetical protein